MKTIALEVGVARHIFVHQICSMNFDNATKKIELCMANRQEFVLTNATIEAYRDMVGKIVTTLNSPQGVIITGINQPAPPTEKPQEEQAEAKAAVEQPILCGSCGVRTATIDGLCGACDAELSAASQSFDGPQS